MAYANLINQTCVDGKSEFFCRLRDFICKRDGTYNYSATGIGWTLHDSSYTVDEDHPQLNDWFVIFSPGESGREQMYVLIKWVTTAAIQIQGWLYWNASTHAGVQNYSTVTACFTMADTAYYPQLWLYGDLDSVFFAEQASANGYSGALGKLSSTGESENIAYSTGAVTAGTSVSITVDIDLPADWVVGNGLFIWDNAGIEKTTILTVDAGAKTITAAATNSYSGTVRISRFLGYFNTTGASLAAFTLCNKANTKAFSLPAPVSIVAISNYDTLDSAYPMAEYYYSFTGGNYGKLRNLRAWAVIAPLAFKDVLVDDDGVEWRCLHINNGKYVVCKEV